MSRYELFLDESGDFFEASIDPREQSQSARGRKAFPSQIAGVLAPAGQFSEQWAAARLSAVKASVGLGAEGELHAKDHGREAVSQLVEDILVLFEDQGLQPVRIVNQEGVSYGNKQLIYVSMLAELALRICATLARAGERQIELSIVTAKVFLDPPSPGGKPWPIPADAYDMAIQQVLGFQAVQRGSAAAAGGWRIQQVRLRHAADDARLQFSDVISNASKADFSKISHASARRLRGAFGEYDFALKLPPVLQSIDSLIQDGYLGMALCAIAQRLVNAAGGNGDVFAPDPDLQRVLRTRLEDVLVRLAATDAAPRNAHLQVVVVWLEQLIDGRLAVASGAQIADWMGSRVAEPLSRRCSAMREIDWFEFACVRWKLTAANHLGDLEAATVASRQLEATTQKLAGRWEHATLLLDAMITRAVHLTDSWEPAEASRLMGLVERYYDELGALFSAAMPSVFPDEIRSDVRARALGTWLQAEIAACAVDPQRIVEARRISDLALQEFGTEADVRRQCQYRSHLETLAQSWQEAETHLARGVGLKDTPSLQALAAHIARMEPRGQGFPLLHLMRLLARRASEGSAEDRELAGTALRESRVLTVTRWADPEETELVEYPRHGVLRYAATAAAATGDYARGVLLVGALRLALDTRTGPLALVPIELAGLTEVGLIGLNAGDRFAPRLLGTDRGDKPGAAFIASVLAERAERCGMARMAEHANRWRSALIGIVEEPTSRDHRNTLVSLARSV